MFGVSDIICKQRRTTSVVCSNSDGGELMIIAREDLENRVLIEKEHKKLFDKHIKLKNIQLESRIEAIKEQLMKFQDFRFKRKIQKHTNKDIVHQMTEKKVEDYPIETIDKFLEISSSNQAQNLDSQLHYIPSSNAGQSKSSTSQQQFGQLINKDLISSPRISTSQGPQRNQTFASIDQKQKVFNNETGETQISERRLEIRNVKDPKKEFMKLLSVPVEMPVKKEMPIQRVELNSYSELKQKVWKKAALALSKLNRKPIQNCLRTKSQSDIYSPLKSKESLKTQQTFQSEYNSKLIAKSSVNLMKFHSSASLQTEPTTGMSNQNLKRSLTQSSSNQKLNLHLGSSSKSVQQSNPEWLVNSTEKKSTQEQIDGEKSQKINEMENKIENLTEFDQIGKFLPYHSTNQSSTQNFQYNFVESLDSGTHSTLTITQRLKEQSVNDYLPQSTNDPDAKPETATSKRGTKILKIKSAYSLFEQAPLTLNQILTQRQLSEYNQTVSPSALSHRQALNNTSQKKTLLNSLTSISLSTIPVFSTDTTETKCTPQKQFPGFQLKSALFEKQSEGNLIAKPSTATSSKTKQSYAGSFIKGHVFPRQRKIVSPFEDLCPEIVKMDLKSPNNRPSLWTPRSQQVSDFFNIKPQTPALESCHISTHTERISSKYLSATVENSPRRNTPLHFSKKFSPKKLSLATAIETAGPQIKPHNQQTYREQPLMNQYIGLSLQTKKI